MLVSVVIPTYNPGRYIDACVASLLAQTLSRDRFEVIIVDDGSTDGTPAYLDALAAEHPNIHVIHSEHSGWAGRPRNIGIGRAVGEYIQFVDQDDRMAPDALRRLIDMAQRNHSDVILGKAVTDFRKVAISVYARNREACTIYDSPVINSLTPHKMFRRAFLEEHRITFPEGTRRLEDQQFVLKAYFAASVISIVADEPCYFYLGREDGGNAGSARMEPNGYYANVREVIDIVLANTQPGDVRARLLRRFALVELLGRLNGLYYVRWEPDFRQAVYENVRAVYLDVIDELVESDLGGFARLRARMLRDDRPDLLLELARRVLDLRAPSRIDSARWSDGRLKIGFTVPIEHADGTPVTLVRRDGRWYLDPKFTNGIVAAPIDITDAMDEVRVGVLLHERTTHVEWALPTKVTLEPVDVGEDPDGSQSMALSVRAELSIEPETAAVGRAIPAGDWSLRVRVAAFGLDVGDRLGIAPGSDATVRATQPMFREPDRLVTLGLAADGGAVLNVERVDAMPAGRDVYHPPAVSRLAHARASIGPVAWRGYDRLPMWARRPSVAIALGARSAVRRGRANRRRR